jgi:hypothetical protein
LLLPGTAHASEREWQVAANSRATADEIIDTGHAADIATSTDQMVVTWEVQPEDDEGTSQGAWRLYDLEKGKVADGTFGAVREAGARIDVVAVRDGFLLRDYKKHALHFLNRAGKLSAAHLPDARPGTSLAGGTLIEGDSEGRRTWQAILPARRQIASLTGLPTTDVQGIELTADGTVWVLLPWTGDGPFRIAHAKDGQAPWTTETIPIPKGSATDGGGLSASGERLFVLASHENGDRIGLDALLAREAGESEWSTVDTSGIADNLTSAPSIAVLPKGRLLAVPAGNGAWIEQEDGEGWAPLNLPTTDRQTELQVRVEGRWLWASQELSGNALYYSHDYGKTWHEFDR